jgi:hypothetical protein
MPEYKSPLGSRQFAGQPMREFDVPDESGYSENYPDMTPVMRRRGASMHGAQPPVDVQAAMQFQQSLEQENPAEIERQMKEARQARLTGRERLSDGAKRRIEMLVGMTRTTRQVDIENNKFVLQTLRSQEMRQAITQAAEFDGTVQFPFEIRRQLLARSLTEISGVEVSQFIGNNTVEARLDLIDQLDEPLLNRLYDEYLILAKDAGQKYAIKSDEEAQEVAEDLKK